MARYKDAGTITRCNRKQKEGAGNVSTGKVLIVKRPIIS